ncbi:hypothetical protein GCM10010317_029010 [Streptomyces mirabilis]|nr:hypothetical protein GCM10010317_029010 [Streptomyces mirabilis]
MRRMTGVVRSRRGRVPGKDPYFVMPSTLRPPHDPPCRHRAGTRFVRLTDDGAWGTWGMGRSPGPRGAGNCAPSPHHPQPKSTRGYEGQSPHTPYAHLCRTPTSYDASAPPADAHSAE